MAAKLGLPFMNAIYETGIQDSITIYRVVQKMAQSLWHHNFATIHHRCIRFSAKCSERNSLHNLRQCL